MSRLLPHSAARLRSRTPKPSCEQCSCGARSSTSRSTALVIGIPSVTPYLPRERPNPLLAAYLGLGLALRLWRDAFPIVDGGTAILLNRFSRHFAHPTQQPYRTFFHATRTGRDPRVLADAERAAATDARALEAYRSGRTVHPLLPFRDWKRMPAGARPPRRCALSRVREMPRPSASSASCRSTACTRRSRWRAAKVTSGSASC